MLELGFFNGVALLTMVVVIGVWRKRSKPKPMESFLVSNPPQDTVVLHQYGPALTVPSISPFVMKMETYLRAAGIPYVNKFDRWPGPKDKLPWIQYNHQVVADSQMCIEFLNQERCVDLNKKLSPSDWAVGHLLRRTCEESLYWALLMWRLVFDKDATIYNRMSIPKPVIWYMRRMSYGRLWSQGIGRHKEQEVTQIMEDDLSALSTMMGDHKFLFGDTKDCVSEFDCAVFGQLCQLVWQMPGCCVQETIAKKYPNLVSFCENMKAAFWPDWEDRLLKTVKKMNCK
ncbi:hypothetical protein EGW08_022277 [Elysia chlorotica]|uniref:GST C-terminal domain-containing protein n=1 Tax=Elysia chlorotica TaxID=188477 RepID=A0A433SLE7_ELYCH|nr:hypothetical protein EGW08_022277 [Elysia chlorotica]